MSRSRTSESPSWRRASLGCAETDVFMPCSLLRTPRARRARGECEPSPAHALQVLLRVVELGIHLHGGLQLRHRLRLLALLLEREPEAPARRGPGRRADLRLAAQVVTQVALGARRLLAGVQQLPRGRVIRSAVGGLTRP